MKKLILFGVSILLSTGIFSQVVRNVRTISIDKSKIEQELLDEATIRSTYKFTQPVTVNDEIMNLSDTMTLDIGPKVSRYYDWTRIRRDSTFASNMNNKLNPNAIRSMTVIKDQTSAPSSTGIGTGFESSNRGETAQLFKNRKKQEIIIIDRAEGSIDPYKCTEKVAPQQWEITSDTLTVLGYLCQKATTSFRGRNYIAWFTSDIPVNDGPWKFYGLPGLILKVNDSENLFSFEIVGLEQLQPPTNIFMAKDDYVNCKRKDIEKLRAKRSGGMAVQINGGDVVIRQKANNTKYTPLEKD